LRKLTKPQKYDTLYNMKAQLPQHKSHYKYFIFIFFLFIFLSTPNYSKALTKPVNSGFVSGIWYSQTPFFADETIRIYSAIQNESGFDITGSIRFYDNDNIIGESNFSSISGHLIEEWVDWAVTEGEHKIKVEIINPVKSSPDSAPEAITLLSSISETATHYADIDTDGDRVGNTDDDDDDNDGLTDEREIELGLNPLKKDTDNDGKDDSEQTEQQELIENKINSDTQTSDNDENKKTDNKETTIVDKATNIIKNISGTLEKGVNSATQKIILSLERKVNDLEDISDNKDTSNNKKKSFLKNFLSIMLSLLIWLFENKFVLYSSIFIILIIIWRILRIFKRR